MINPKCVRCGKELREFGGTLFSPPRKQEYDYEQTVDKYHLCVNCYAIIFQWIVREKENKS